MLLVAFAEPRRLRLASRHVYRTDCSACSRMGSRDRLRAGEVHGKPLPAEEPPPNRPTVYEFDVVRNAAEGPEWRKPYVSRYQFGSQSRAGTPIPRPTSAGAVSDERFYRTGLSGTGETSISSSRANRVAWSHVGKCSLKFQRNSPGKRISAFPCRTPTRPLSRNSPRNMAI